MNPAMLARHWPATQVAELPLQLDDVVQVSPVGARPPKLATGPTGFDDWLMYVRTNVELVLLEPATMWITGWAPAPTPGSGTIKRICPSAFAPRSLAPKIWNDDPIGVHLGAPASAPPVPLEAPVVPLEALVVPLEALVVPLLVEPALPPVPLPPVPPVVPNSNPPRMEVQAVAPAAAINRNSLKGWGIVTGRR